MLCLLHFHGTEKHLPEGRCCLILVLNFRFAQLSLYIAPAIHNPDNTHCIYGFPWQVKYNVIVYRQESQPLTSPWFICIKAVPHWHLVKSSYMMHDSLYLPGSGFGREKVISIYSYIFLKSCRAAAVYSTAQLIYHNPDAFPLQFRLPHTLCPHVYRTFLFQFQCQTDP